MSIEQLPPHVRVTRFYTAVRRIPTLVGKLPNGGFIPGGPYTLGQIALMLLVAVGGFYTMPWWGGGQGANLGNFIKLALVVALTSMASSKIRWRGRQVLPALRGAVYSYTHGSQPRQGGRTPTGTGPQRLRTNILIIEDLPAPTLCPLALEPRDQQVEGTLGGRGVVIPSARRRARVRPLAGAPAVSLAVASIPSAAEAPARSGPLTRRQPSSPPAASGTARTGLRSPRSPHLEATADPGASRVTASSAARTTLRRPAPNPRPERVELVDVGGGR